MNSEKPAPGPAHIGIGPEHPFSQVIEDAYRVFATPTPTETGVCVRCCMDAAIEEDFFNPPIRALPLAYLRDWYFAAHDPGGVPKPVWTYLLPRILELMAVGEDVCVVGEEVTLRRFKTGDPAQWNPAQWDVLERFRYLYLARAIEDESVTGYLDDTVCMFALAGWTLDDLLAQVAAADDAVLARRLFRDWCPFGSHGGKIWITAFWESPGNSRAYQFYTSQGLYERMEALALSDAHDPEVADMASCVASVIEAAIG